MSKFVIWSFLLFDSFSRLVILLAMFILGQLRTALGLENFGLGICFPWSVVILMRKTCLKYVLDTTHYCSKIFPFFMQIKYLKLNSSLFDPHRMVY